MSVTILNKNYDIKTTKVLDFSNCSLTDIPAEIGNLTNLQYLYLENNSLTNLPAEICNLTNLQILNLNYNQLTNLPAEKIGRAHV